VCHGPDSPQAYDGKFTVWKEENTRCHVKEKKTEGDRRRGPISNLEEENGKGLADILSPPTRKQFQVTADNLR
jgi:hypothetical protein